MTTEPEPIATWYDITDTLGVLELHGGLTAPGPALELHVFRNSEKTRACWVTDNGRLQVWVRVAEA